MRVIVIGNADGRARNSGKMSLATVHARGLVALLLSVLWVSTHTLASQDASAQDRPSAPGFIVGLTDQHGKVVTRGRLFGKPAVVNFGFTHCPVICPTTLLEVSLLMQRLGPKADKLNFVFATVDPERDTAPVLKEYVDSFDKRIIALTGSAKAIAKLAKHFGTTYAKRPTEDGYNVDHAVFAYLTNTGGKVVSTLYLGTSANPALIEKRLEGLLSSQQ